MKRTSVLTVLVLLLAGCGSSGSSQFTVGAARTFALAGFAPSKFAAGKPTRLSFTIDQPSGRPLTSYRTGSGPHTGVHLIIVRSDLGVLIHRHPPVGAAGRISETITLPTPGKYRVVVDAYPNLSGPLRNFQLFSMITAPGTAPRTPIGSFHRTAVVSGYRFALKSRQVPGTGSKTPTRNWPGLVALPVTRVEPRTLVQPVIPAEQTRVWK